MTVCVLCSDPTIAASAVLQLGDSIFPHQEKTMDGLCGILLSVINMH